MLTYKIMCDTSPEKIQAASYSLQIGSENRPKSNLVNHDAYCTCLREYGGGVTGEEMTQTAASPKPTPGQVTDHKAGHLEPTAQPAGSSAG